MADDLVPSPELAGIARRYLLAYGANDADTLRNLYADDPAVRHVGTADDEFRDGATLRIGIHTGDVIQTRDDFFGTVVNKAARVAAAAGPDEIRVSEATRLKAGNARGLRFADPMTVTLKGLEGDHLIHTLDWQP